VIVGESTEETDSAEVIDKERAERRLATALNALKEAWTEETDSAERIEALSTALKALKEAWMEDTDSTEAMDKAIAAEDALSAALRALREAWTEEADSTEAMDAARAAEDALSAALKELKEAIIVTSGGSTVTPEGRIQGADEVSWRLNPGCTEHAYVSGGAGGLSRNGTSPL
jgi:hypothetical protein